MLISVLAFVSIVVTAVTTSLNLHDILYGQYKYTDHVKLESILVLDAVDFTKEYAVLSSKLEVETEKKGGRFPGFMP